MPHEDPVRDVAHLWDMLQAALQLTDLVEGPTEQDYLGDRTLQLAVERLVEIIGEAAGRVSEQTRGAHPEIPWRGIIGQRNVIAHEYGEIVQERLWRVAVERIPELIEQLRPLIPAPPEVD